MYFPSDTVMLRANAITLIQYQSVIMFTPEFAGERICGMQAERVQVPAVVDLHHADILTCVLWRAVLPAR